MPFAPYRVLERYANLILNTFVSTVAINEGANAVSRNLAPVGVSVFRRRRCATTLTLILKRHRHEYVGHRFEAPENLCPLR